LAVALPRLQLFEFNDQSWAPLALRETIVEGLSRTLEWGHILEHLAPPFREFLQRAGTHEVLDLCSGAGGPASILARELERAGTPVKFLLTDLHPHPESWQSLRASQPGVVDFVPDSVDATHIPEALGGRRARVIINSFHHFSPELARAILRGAVVDGAPGIFVAEGFERNPLLFAPFVPAGLPALMAGPVLSARRKFQKALLAWATPVGLLASIWDGVVSTLRVYTEAELREMVAPLGGGFEWTYGRYTFSAGGRGYYFYGVRVS
jgi:hypothetical protein